MTTNLMKSIVCASFVAAAAFTTTTASAAIDTSITLDVDGYKNSDYAVICDTRPYYDVTISLGVGIDDVHDARVAFTAYDSNNALPGSEFNAFILNFIGYELQADQAVDGFNINYNYAGQDFTFAVDYDLNESTIAFNQVVSEETIKVDGQEYAMEILGADLYNTNSKERLFSIYNNPSNPNSSTPAEVYMQLKAVPEPASMVLFGLGVLALIKRRR